MKSNINVLLDDMGLIVLTANCVLGESQNSVCERKTNITRKAFNLINV